MITGLVLALVVTFSPRRKRRPIVSAAIPLVALVVSETPIMIIGHGRAGLAFATLDTGLTLVGAAWILLRYRGLEKRNTSIRVH